MLILKRPMQLQSISGIAMYSDKLGEKIIANYQLIGMELTSADLLHMMVQEREQFLNTAYCGVLTVENHIYANNQIKLELINQLVNRLMLCFSPEFTYQDEVFVVSVLQKIGISDTKEFMQQIHRHMDYNILLKKLFNFYVSYKKQIREIVSFVQENLQEYQGSYKTFQENSQQYNQKFYETERKNTWNKEYQFSYYLHNQIFRRLMTAECNRIIDSYDCQLDKTKATVQGAQKAVWAEQADVLALSQFREMMFWQTNPAVWQNDIYYERKRFAQEALTEETVVQRIVAAILENMVQKLHGVCQQRGKNIVNQIQWRDYTQTFCQSAADVLERFWYYQGKQTVEMDKYESYVNRMVVLVQDEWKLTQLLKDFATVHNRKDWEEIGSEVVLSIWENQNLQRQLSGRIQLEERLAAQNYLWDMYLEEQQEYQLELNKFQEIKNQWIQLKKRFMEQNNKTPFRRQKLEHDLPINQQEIHKQHSNMPPQEAQYYLDLLQSQTIQTQEAQHNIDMPPSQEIHNNLRIPINQEMHDNINILQRQNAQQYEIKDILQEKKLQKQQPHMALNYSQNKQKNLYNYMDEFLHKYEKLISGQEIPFAENKRLLDEINEHNLQMKHLFDSANATSTNGDTLRRVAVDQKRARQSALRALENPQEALREVYAYATAIEEDLSPEIERILRVTDENTQLFYRQLLGHQNTCLPSGQNSMQDNKIFHTDNIGTQAQFSREKELAVERGSVDFSVEKLFATEDIKENTINIKYERHQIERILKQIAECEHSIYQEQILRQDVDAAFFADKVFLEKRNLTEIRTFIKLLENRVVIENKEWKNIDFAYQHEQQSTDFLEPLENRFFETSDYNQQAKKFHLELQTQLEQLKQQQIEQRQLIQQQLQDIRQKLLREGEEQFTQIINYSLKTQVHTISDIVYHELERRLKNEQRRRGY